MRFSNKTKTIFLATLLLFICKNLFPYSATKHHRVMGKKAVEESVVDEYLKNNLGFSKGINNTLTNPDEPAGEQTKTIKEWIGYGSVKEDDLIPRPPLLTPRVVAHFYDPVSNQGLHNIYINSLEFGESFESNLYSWSKAREYYYLALTSPTKEEREKYWALTFRSLGQVLHLVQDLASPAHVRNDNHLPIGDNADPYEDTWGKTSEGVSTIAAAADSEYPVVQLDQFDDYWDTESGQGLAEFTNSNFVSRDTNLDKLPGDPHHYDNPQQTGIYVEPYTFTDSNGILRTVNVPYRTSNVIDNYAPEKGVNPFNYLTAVSYWDFYTFQENPERRVYTLNSKCHQEYAKLLVPRTVGYGAGLLNYCFRKELNVRTEIDLDGWLVFYVSTDGVDIEDLYDNIEIYREEYNGIRFKIENPPDLHPDAPRHFEKEIIGNEVKLKVDVLQNSAVKFVMVYKGPITENEEEIVIGKVLNIVLNGLPPWENQIGGRIKRGVGEASGEASTPLDAANIAYLEFINDLPEWEWGSPYRSGSHHYIGSYISARIGRAGPEISYFAGQDVMRGYTAFDFNYFQDKNIDRVLFFLSDSYGRRDEGSSEDPNTVEDYNNVEVYRDLSNNWPASWNSGGIFIFSPRGPFYDGRYPHTGLIELNLDLLNLTGLNVFGARYINDTLNYIPPLGEYDGMTIYYQSWSATLIEIIFYSEESKR